MKRNDRTFGGRLMMAGLTLFFLTGCSVTLDTTDSRTQRESLRAMVDRLDESEKLRFADALNLLAKEDELALEMVPQAGGRLEGLLQGKSAADIVRIGDAVRRKWLTKEHCAALDRVATKMINYAARKSNSRKDKKLPPTHDVAAGVGLAEHHELIGGEKMAFGKNVSFAIYQERGRRTFAALHPGCVDRYGAPKVVYWDFVKGGEAVWF